MRKIIKFALVLLLITFFLVLFMNNYIPSEMEYKLSKLDLDNVNNLMIVAHPDDESLWGGDHLAKDNYLVVCITCGEVKIRKEEFEKAMKEFDNIPLSLGYPDKTNGVKDNWSRYYYKIKKDIKKIVNYKNWDTIVTHNPDGEYGHIHHKMTSTIVTSVSLKNNLYYFNKYYTNEELENINYCMKKLTDEDLKIKEFLLSNYKSQEEIIDGHRHNIVYERFIPYNMWK